jgi:CheY-like chemotaxis protein
LLVYVVCLTLAPPWVHVGRISGTGFSGRLAWIHERERLMAGGTVLIVEDEQSAREALTEILQYEGFDVATAADGAEAWQYLQESAPPCLIVLDLMMPVMDGRQFRTLQLQDPWLAKIPVVIVSALGPSSVADLHPIAVVQKPVNVDALLEVIEANC